MTREGTGAAEESQPSSEPVTLTPDLQLQEDLNYAVESPKNLAAKSLTNLVSGNVTSVPEHGVQTVSSPSMNTGKRNREVVVEVQVDTPSKPTLSNKLKRPRHTSATANKTRGSVRGDVFDFPGGDADKVGEKSEDGDQDEAPEPPSKRVKPRDTRSKRKGRPPTRKSVNKAKSQVPDMTTLNRRHGLRSGDQRVDDGVSNEGAPASLAHLERPRKGNSLPKTSKASQRKTEIAQSVRKSPRRPPQRNHAIELTGANIPDQDEDSSYKNGIHESSNSAEETEEEESGDNAEEESDYSAEEESDDNTKEEESGNIVQDGKIVDHAKEKDASNIADAASQAAVHPENWEKMLKVAKVVKFNPKNVDKDWVKPLMDKIQRTAKVFKEVSKCDRGSYHRTKRQVSNILKELRDHLESFPRNPTPDVVRKNSKIKGPKGTSQIHKQIYLYVIPALVSLLRDHVDCVWVDRNVTTEDLQEVVQLLKSTHDLCISAKNWNLTFHTEFEEPVVKKVHLSITVPIRNMYSTLETGLKRRIEAAKRRPAQLTAEEERKRLEKEKEEKLRQEILEIEECRKKTLEDLSKGILAQRERLREQERREREERMHRQSVQSHKQQTQKPHTLVSRSRLLNGDETAPARGDGRNSHSSQRQHEDDFYSDARVANDWTEEEVLNFIEGLTLFKGTNH
jgi:hypothetical protein